MDLRSFAFSKNKTSRVGSKNQVPLATRVHALPSWP